MTIKQTYEKQLKRLVRKRKTKNPRDWKTINSFEDVQKFEEVRMINVSKKRGRGVKNETLIKQINQVKAIHKKFPLVRFYDFHKQAQIFQENLFEESADYERCRRTPDGYYFDQTLGIFLIEIENYSRVTDVRLEDYISWWADNFDWIEYVPIIIMEFNRFGAFQRNIIKETYDKRSSVKILKEAMKNG
jgi:hypothetical protein